MTATQAPTPGPLTAEDLARTTVEIEEVFRLTLCGSTKFRAEYELWNKRLTLAGFLVYSVSGFGHSGDTFNEEEKARLDQIHLAKIDASHAIVVLNVGGYVGESTSREIAYAKAAGKPVYFLEGNNIIYRLRTGPDGANSLRYRAFDWGSLAPTAPVEASGSEREHGPKCWGKTSLSDEMAHCYCGSPDARPQPSGETREALDRLKMAAHVYEDDEMAADCATLEALLSARPLALGGQHSTATDFPPDDVLACMDDTTPARAEALDEGAAGEPVAWRFRKLESVCLDPPRSHWSTVRFSPRKPRLDAHLVRDLEPLYAHPSPTPAADADRVRIAVEAFNAKINAPLTGPTHGAWDRGRIAGLKEALAALKSTAAQEGGTK